MELNYLFGEKITKEKMDSRIKGTAFHEELERETATVPIILMPMSYADSLYKILYMSNAALEALPKNGRCREVQIYGKLNGFRLVGKIDMLEIKDGRVSIYEDKTKTNEELPSEPQLKSHKAQVITYRKMFDDIASARYTADDFRKDYRTSGLKITQQFAMQLDSLKVPKEEQSIDRIAESLFASFHSLPQLSDNIYLRYTSQLTGKEIKLYKFTYHEEEMKSTLGFVLSYWSGERESLPVPEEEKWKCKWCGFFGNRCKVWWPQQKL